LEKPAEDEETAIESPRFSLAIIIFCISFVTCNDNARVNGVRVNRLRIPFVEAFDSRFGDPI
jgi:hypothetical protein